MNRFARIDSQKNPYFHNCARDSRIASNLRFAILGPQSAIRKKRGSVRKPWNDSRESGDSHESANRFARIRPSKIYILGRRAPGKNQKRKPAARTLHRDYPGSCPHLFLLWKSVKSKSNSNLRRMFQRHRLARRRWETDFFPVPNSSPVLDKNLAHPWVQTFCPVLGLGSGGSLRMHFQTPVLYWINFSLRVC